MRRAEDPKRPDTRNFAGTSDISSRRRGRTDRIFPGSKTERLYDVGIAGLHRLLDHGLLLQRARVFVVVAGMEGALPSPWED